MYNHRLGQKESSLIKKHLSKINPGTERRFRINAGRGWVGQVLRGPSIRQYLAKFGPKNCILIVKPRPFIGAPNGFPDTIGWDTIEITPDMVGQRVAVFVGEEYKATGSLSDVQRKFGNLLARMGGIFRVIRD